MATVCASTFSGFPGVKTIALLTPGFPTTVIVSMVNLSGYATTVNLECPSGFSIWNDTIPPRSSVEVRGLVLTPGNTLFAIDNSQALNGMQYLVSGYNTQ
jgi:hypothetical protein